LQETLFRRPTLRDRRDAYIVSERYPLSDTQPSAQQMTLWLRSAMLLSVIVPWCASAQLGAVFRGRVLVDSTEAPLSGAEIVLPKLGLLATTDSFGRFRVSGISPGTHSILVRRIGFAPFAGRIEFRGRDSLDVEFVMEPKVSELPEISVTTTLVQRKLVEFNERRRLGVGHFLDSVALANGPGSRLSEKLRHLPGLIVNCRGTVCSLLSTRGQVSFTGRCPVRLGLDGVEVNGFNLNWLDPNEVAGIEWYAGPAQMPARFNSSRSSCGFLMIWTK
jgi:hypothetical protein